MIDSAKQHDMLKDKKEGEGEEKGENMNLELTNDELKQYKNVEITRK